MDADFIRRNIIDLWMLKKKKNVVCLFFNRKKKKNEPFDWKQFEQYVDKSTLNFSRYSMDQIE